MSTSMAAKEIDARQVILWYWNHRTKNRQEIIKLTGLPKTTVYSVTNRIKTGKGVERKVKRGVGAKLQAEDRRRITHLARSHPLWSASNIAAEAARRGSPLVHPATVRRSLRKSGYRKWTPIRGPNLTPLHIKKRLEWCLKNRRRNWKKTVFTDESFFVFFRNKVKQWGRKRPCIPVPKYSPSIMVWGGISHRGTTSLHMTRGKINSDTYQAILRDNLQPIKALYPQGFTLQQDGATPHTSKSTQKFLEEGGYEVLDWPPNSPDLSPIENLWGIMKNALEKEIDRSPENWMAIIQRIWDEDVPQYLESLIGSMEGRIESCIAAKGGKF